MKKREVLEKAIELITGERESDYGSAERNFSDIAGLWSVVLGLKVQPWQVALCMSQVKVARLMKTPNHLDSWVDAGGYIGIGGELALLQPEAEARHPHPAELADGVVQIYNAKQERWYNVGDDVTDYRGFAPGVTVGCTREGGYRSLGGDRWVCESSGFSYGAEAFSHVPRQILSIGNPSTP